MNDLISIIIPIYNRANLVAETLDSIINQTFVNWECILIDDGSTDETQKVVESYILKDSRIQFHKRPEHYLKGANSCRNYGFELSSGGVIQWFDSDDIMHKGKLSKQYEDLIKSDKKASVCDFSLFKENKINESLHHANLQDSSMKMYEKFITGEVTLNTQVVLFKREIVEHVKYDESLSRAQDLDFVYRVFHENKLDFKILDKRLVYIRAHENSITNAYHKGDYNAILSEVRVRKRIFDENRGYFSKSIQKKLLTMRLNSIRALLINGFLKDYLVEISALSKNVSIFKGIKLFILSLIGKFYHKTKKGLYLYGRFAKSI